MTFIASELQKKQSQVAKLTSMQDKISHQQSLCEKLRQNFSQDEITKQIESLSKQKQVKEARVAEVADVMKKLNTEATSRATLGLKKQQKKKKEEEYQALYVEKRKNSCVQLFSNRKKTHQRK